MAVHGQSPLPRVSSCRSQGADQAVCSSGGFSGEEATSRLIQLIGRGPSSEVAGLRVLALLWLEAAGCFQVLGAQFFALGAAPTWLRPSSSSQGESLSTRGEQFYLQGLSPD